MSSGCGEENKAFSEPGSYGGEYWYRYPVDVTQTLSVVCTHWSGKDINVLLIWNFNEELFCVSILQQGP